MKPPLYRLSISLVLLGALGWTSDATAGTIFNDNFESGTICAWSPTVGAECLCFDTGLGQLRSIVEPTAGELVISEWMPDPTLVQDSAGEWFEVHALAAIDLNGLQAGTAALIAIPVIPQGGDCLQVLAGGDALLARTSGAGNGGLPPVDATFNFGLLNSGGSLTIGVGDLVLDSKTWVASSPALSIMIDSDGSQCTAPAGVPLYNGTDAGTPRAGNTPPECP